MSVHLLMFPLFHLSSNPFSLPGSHLSTNPLIIVCILIKIKEQSGYLDNVMSINICLIFFFKEYYEHGDTEEVVVSPRHIFSLKLILFLDVIQLVLNRLGVNQAQILRKCFLAPEEK